MQISALMALIIWGTKFQGMLTSLKIHKKLYPQKVLPYHNCNKNYMGLVNSEEGRSDVSASKIDKN